MKISSIVLSLAIASSVEAWSPSGSLATSRNAMTMRVGTFDKDRRQKLNVILREVQSSPAPKELIETKLLAKDTGDMIAKCNWKLRKMLIRKVSTMAAEYGVEVDDKFGYRLTQCEREEYEQTLKQEYAAAKQAKMEAAATAEVERKERKAAKKAQKKVEYEAFLAKTAELKKGVAAEATPEPEPAAEPVAEAAPAAAPATAAAISPKIIKQLRDATGAGMMDCKKALVENDGDMEAATEFLRKKGLAKADKKASRIAAEGKIAFASAGDKAVLVEINCETDFVAKDGSFLEFTETVAKAALDVEGDEIDSLLAAEVDGASIESTRQALVAKIGENIQVRRSASRGGEGSTVGCYVHMNRIGVLVELEGGTEELAADVAMHVAAMNPPYAVPEEVPQDVLEKEKGILKAQALESGKPAEIVDKMVEGRIRKYLEEICLVSQTYVKTNDETVGKLLERNGAKMKGFTRIAVGEGIEKKVDDFAAEVAAMAAGK